MRLRKANAIISLIITVLLLDHGIYNSIFCCILAKTAGAPAVCLEAGDVSLYNIVLRDVTDETLGKGASVVIGSTAHIGQICDVTVRGVKTGRDAIRTCAVCDGMFYSNLHCGGQKLINE